MNKSRLRPGNNPGIKIDDNQGVVYRQVWLAEDINTKEMIGFDKNLNELRMKINNKRGKK